MSGSRSEGLSINEVRIMPRKVPTRRAVSRPGVSLAESRRRRLGDAAAGVAVEGLENRQLFSVFTVTNTADGGAGSLRQAITDANLTTDADQVIFVLDNPGTIALTSPLPAITSPLSIDGRSQAGYAGSPLVEVSGALLGGGVDGFTIAAPDSTIAGLDIDSFGGGAGVRVTAGGDRALVVGNFIGTDVTGTVPLPNADGVVVDAAGAVVTGNLISGNEAHGVWVTAGGDGAKVTGNRIGTDATGSHALQDVELTLAFGVSVDGADGVAVGGPASADGNVIAGSGRAAVTLTGVTNATVQGNLVGVDVTGGFAIGQGSGIAVMGGSDGVSVSGNTISAVQGAGVQVGESSHVTVTGNVIGTVTADALGNTFDDFGSGYEVQGNGVDIGGSSFVTVGGPAAADRNVIAGGDGAGVQVSTLNAASTNVVITGNYIGVLGDGVTAMGWQGNGIFTEPDGVTVTNNVVGAAEGSGIVVHGNGSLVEGNSVGVGADGVTPIPNPYGDGIFLLGSNIQVIGNTIAYNFGNGVTVAAGTGHRISQNSIHDNGLVGIDLGIDGVTANDTAGHVGPNNYQNFPVLGAVVRTPTGVRVSGTLHAAANGTFLVELFANASASATGHGEGLTYLGSVAVTTDANGDGSFGVKLTTVPDGQKVVSATATDAAGNTSEFSADAAVPDAVTTFDTQTAVASSANPSAAGQAVTFTATVTSATGTPGGVVTFYDGNTAIGTGTLANGVATVSTSALAVGDHVITAVYAAQGDYNGSTSAPLAQGVDAATTTAIAVSNVSPTLGDSVTLTATVSSTAGAPGGVVTFYDGGTAIGTGTLDASGVATLVTSSLGGGAHALSAAYAGQGHYHGSSSAQVGVTVSVPTGTALAESAATSTFGGAGVTLTATVTAAQGGVADGVVTFYDGGTLLGVVAVDANGVASFAASGLGAGVHSFTAAYGGAGFHLASASAAVSHHVFVPTATAVSAPSDTATEGQPVMLTATVTAPVGVPGGMVSFFDGGTLLGSVALDGTGMAMLNVSTLAVGGHTITASYAASGDYLASDSGALPLTVNPRQMTNVGTTTAVTSSQNPSTLGQGVTFTATVTADGGVAAGVVTFKDGNAVLGTGMLDASGVATFTTAALGGGAHTITAVYGGQDNYLGSTSAPLAQGVNAATTTTLTESAPSSTFGQGVTFTATVNAPAGVVTFLDGNTVLGTANVGANGVAALTVSALGPGPHSVTASYGGADFYLPSVSAAVSHTVSVTTTTALSASTAAAQYGAVVTFTATVSAPVGVAAGDVNFFDGDTLLGTAAVDGNGVATLATGFLALGGHPIAAVYAGAGSYLGSTSDAVSVAVSTATTTALAASTSSALYGQAVTFTATVTADGGVPGGVVTFFDGGTAIGTGTLDASGVATLVSGALGRGSHSVKAVYAGQPNFAGSTSAPVSVVVNVPTTTTLTASVGSGYCRTGQSVTFTAKVTSANGTPSGTVTFFDGNTAIGTGLLNASGVATLTTSSLGAGTHTITAVYGGGNNYLASASAPLSYGVKSTKATISGTVYRDESGNGLSDDDDALGGVTVKLFLDRNRNGRVDSNDGGAIATDVSDGNGAYSFGNLAAGRYLVQEVTPSGYVRTAPALSDTYAVTADAGDVLDGLDFDNYRTCSCSQNVTGIIYVVNGRTYTDLRGHVHEGDDVSVKFTVRQGANVTLSLVAYTAPGAAFDPHDADEQVIYDLATGTFGQGTYTISVHIPRSYFQVDFVCGEAIDQFGPAGSNVFYSAQHRLYSADNGGTHDAEGIVPLV